MRKILIFALALALPIGAMAADQQLELALGQVDFETEAPDDEADAAGVRYFGYVLDYVSAGASIERLDGDDSGAWALDALLRVHRTHKLVTVYAQGGIGAVISDINQHVEEVTVTATAETEEGGHGNHHGSSSVTASASAELETTDQQVSLRGLVAAGLQVYFSGAMRQGVGLEYGYAAPLGDGFAVESERALRAYYIVPIGGY